MAIIVRAMEDSTFVEYNEFTIIDDGGSGDADAKPFAESWEDRDITAEWLSAADNLIMINSGYSTTHVTRIRLELWDSDPGDGPQHPEVDQMTTAFYSSTGSIAIDDMFGYEDHGRFELGPPGRRWNVRAYRKTLVPPGYFAEGIKEELEAYTLQFWPSS